MALPQSIDDRQPVPPAGQHPRLPAAAVLLLAAALGAALVMLGGATTQGQADTPLADLERAIARSDADAAAWHAYAAKLEELKQYDRAALAYQRVLELEPYHRQAKLHTAIVLAQLGDAERYLAYLGDLTIADPKLAADLFARPENQAYLRQPRFAALARDARSQAMD
ncbi:MAG: hypothetical protein WEC36_03565 [Phycisphaeraceae bacterium]